MKAYASAPGRGRNRDALAAYDWGLIVNPYDPRPIDGFAYAVDDGAWVARQRFLKGEVPTPVLDLDRYSAFIAVYGGGADFVIAPDIVEGGGESLALTRQWLPKLQSLYYLGGVTLMVAVQDGMTMADIADLIGPEVGIAIGGSTDWKLETLRYWCEQARAAGAPSHVLRVNTERRIRMCEAAGADSFDGSSPSRYSVNLPRLDRSRRQTDIEGHLARMTGDSA